MISSILTSYKYLMHASASTVMMYRISEFPSLRDAIYSEILRYSVILKIPDARQRVDGDGVREQRP